MLQRVPPHNSQEEQRLRERPHAAGMLSVIEEGLLSPLLAPRTTSITDGIRIESLAQAQLIISSHLHPLGTPKDPNPCEKQILETMRRTQGNFSLSLTNEERRNTAIPLHSPTIEMRPIGALGWKLAIGDMAEQSELLRGTRASALRVGEQLVFPLAPIPKMGGVSGFSSLAAAHALRASPLFADKVDPSEDANSLCTTIATEHGRFRISCTLGFWVEGHVLHRDGHYAFAPKLYNPRPQHKEQLRIDITPLAHNGTPVMYTETPPLGTEEIVKNTTLVITDSFSPRSPHRKTRLAELMEL